MISTLASDFPEINPFFFFFFFYKGVSLCLCCVFLSACRGLNPHTCSRFSCVSAVDQEVLLRWNALEKQIIFCFDISKTGAVRAQEIPSAVITEYSFCLLSYCHLSILPHHFPSYDRLSIWTHSSA